MAEIDYAAIDLLVLDVDGVLTDGRIYLSPEGETLKVFHVRDGSGLKYWKRCGGRIAIVTGRASPVVAVRAKELDIDAVYTGAKDKLPAYEQTLRELGGDAGRTAVIGDDLPDLPMMQRCALPMAPADAVGEVKDAAAHVLTLGGGQGCVREAIELILRRAGKWNDVLRRYYPQGDMP